MTSDIHSTNKVTVTAPSLGATALHIEEDIDRPMYMDRFVDIEICVESHKSIRLRPWLLSPGAFIHHAPRCELFTGTMSILATGVLWYLYLIIFIFCTCYNETI